MFNLGEEVGGKSVHIKDCYIWSEIHYLDSATDYREYLPQNAVQPRTIPCDDLVLLDSSKRLSNHYPLWRWGFLVMFLIISYLLRHDM
jgi:hypothetical protein